MFSARGIYGKIFSGLVVCNVDIRENLFVNVVSPGDMAFFKGTGKRMFKELTALAPFTMMFRWLLHLSESTQCGLECRGWLVEFRTLFPVLRDVRRWYPREFVRHVVLSGGTTIFQRIMEHMTNELTALAPSTMTSRRLLRFASSRTETSSLSRRTFPLCGSIVPATFSQTETSSLSAPNVSCGVKVLFQPCFTSKEASGVHDTSFRCFMKCDVTSAKFLYVNVVPSG